VFRIKAPLVTPFRIATGQHDFLENIFFVVRPSGGIKGYGEAAVATHITGETLALTQKNLEKAGRVLEGRDFSDPIALAREFRPMFDGNHAGLAAFETALLDAYARRKKVPLWRLFGKRPRRFSTDITIVIGTVEQARQAAKDFFARGFRSFKVKVGRDQEEDMVRVLAVAGAAPGAGIILDANQGYDAPRMLKFLAVLKAAGVVPVLLEQPVPKEDWDGLARLTRESGMLVCADESVKNLEDVKKAVSLKAVSAVNIKLMKSGIVEAGEIAAFAHTKGIKLMIGAMMESKLAISAAAHVAAGLGLFDFVDLDTTFFVKGAMARCPFIDKAGRFDLSAAPAGIGVTVNKDDQ
jgi:L-alanine-DL-glutamate epimerase-like enolase superfamily enzyme